MLDGNDLPGILLDGLVNRTKASACDQLLSVSESSAIEGDRNRTPQLLHHLVAIRHGAVGRHFAANRGMRTSYSFLSRQQSSNTLVLGME